MDVCDYVVCYLNRTLKYRLRAVRRGQPKPRQLFFLAYTGKPRRRITISKYLLKTMSLAGKDTDCFKAHSTRGFGPSYLIRKGSSPNKIFSHGNWKSIVAFNRHYNRAPEVSSDGQCS